MGKVVRAEVKTLSATSTNSILQQLDLTILKSFSWRTLLTELAQHTPVLKGVLESTGVPGQNRSNFDAVVCLCVTLLARNRNPRMNLIAKMLSLILYAGHSSKQVS